MIGLLLPCPDAPDTTYATYTRLALGVLRQVRRRGLDVPADIGLASAVDGEILRWVEPSITAAFLHPRLLGAEAVSTLVGLVEGTPVAASGMVPSRLMVRRSTRRGRAPHCAEHLAVPDGPRGSERPSRAAPL